LQRIYPTYDTYFQEILSHVDKMYPGSTLIDIGANVGDTSVGVHACAPSMKVIAVEGNPFFLKFASRNLNPLADSIRLIPKYVSCEASAEFKYSHDGSTGGFSSGDIADFQSYEEVSAEELLGMSNSILTIWKSDTDGLDVPIVLENLELLKKKAGIWWLELHPLLPPTTLEKIEELLGGVSQQDRTYVLFDNFGRKVSSGLAKNDLSKILRLLNGVGEKSQSRNAEYYDIFLIDVLGYPKLSSLS
jgi:FkbM family methyltransferase